jgi:hypothetical protein
MHKLGYNCDVATKLIKKKKIFIIMSDERVTRKELQTQRQKRYFAFAIFAVLSINAWMSVIAIAQERADLTEAVCGEKPDRSDSEYNDYQECKSNMELYYLEFGLDSLFTAVISAAMYTLAALFFYGYFGTFGEEDTSVIYPPESKLRI